MTGQRRCRPGEREIYAFLDEIEEVTIEDWEMKREEVKAEHKLQRVRRDLIDGWKAWLVANGPTGKGKLQA